MWSNLKRQLWEWRGVLIAAPSVAALVLALRFVGVLQLLEWAAYDQLMRLRPLESEDSRIVIVGINESDLQKVERGIVPDIFLAQLLEKIKLQQPRAIGLDIYRDLPEEPGHQALVKVYESTPNLIGIERAISAAGIPAVNPPPVLKKLDQVGANDFPLDADLKLRRGFLYLWPPNREMVQSLALRLALIYLEKEKIKQVGVPNAPNQFRLGKAIFSPFETNDGSYIRANAAGYQIILNFRGPAKSFKTVSMTEVLEGQVAPDLMRDRIVLIGYTAESKNDYFSTPFSSTLLGFPKPTSGVEIHANLTSQLLSSALEGRPLIKSWTELVEWLWIFGWSLVGAILSWQGRYKGGVTGFTIWRLGKILLAVGGLVGVSYLLFLEGWWIPLVPPMLALAGSAIAVTSYVARTAGEIRKTFGRYLTDEVVAKLLESPEGLQLGGERRKVTIVMSDLRGFSAVSERLPPETVVSMLNIYLGAMADVITSYQGTIDEFIGDAILVIFGAPTQRVDDTERAIACAIAMQLAMDPVNQTNAQMGLPKIEMGIGISTGEVVVGNIGSHKRAKYGVVGSNVNLTGRIESYTVGGQILISEATYKEVEHLARIDGQMNVQPKGFNEPITLYEVGGIYGKHNLFLSQEEDILVLLPEEFPLQYTVLDGKHVDGTLFKGSLVKLSANGAEVRAERTEKPLSNIKMNLLQGADESEPSGDLYAKVVEASTPDETSFTIRFTAIPPEIEAMLTTLYEKLKAS